jgi:hypothetical protein
VAAQWFLAHTAQALVHLRDPFVTGALDAPRGVNLAAQAALVGVGVPLAPLTLLVGVQVSYLVVLVASLAGTATGWYWLLWSRLRRHWLAATLAGAYCGFHPHLVAEAAGRNHVALQVLVPVIIWHVVRLGEPDHPLRRGLLLGALIAWQALIGEEVLLLTALGTAVFGAAYLAQRRDLLRLAGRYARGLGTAAATAAVLLAYPLGRQFFGPGRVDGFPIDLWGQGTALSMWLGLPSRWAPWLPGRYATSQWWAVTGYPVLGLPLLALLAGTVLALRRRPVVPACALVALFFAVASLGSRIWLGPHGAVAGPWRLVATAPLARVMVPERLALGAVAAAGVLLGYGLDALLRWSGAALAARRPWWRQQLAAGALTAGALLVAAAAVQLWPPRPPVWSPQPVPAFVTSGAYRPYLAGGRTLLSAPPASQFWIDGQRWAVAADARFAIPGGYFIGPAPGGHGALWGAPPRWTTTYLEQTVTAGQPPAAQPGDRERFLADLRYWRAGVLVLAPGQVHWAALADAVGRFLGPPLLLAGAWIWDVRALT